MADAMSPAEIIEEGRKLLAPFDGRCGVYSPPDRIFRAALDALEAATAATDEARWMYCDAKAALGIEWGYPPDTPRDVCVQTWPADADRLFPKEGAK